MMFGYKQLFCLFLFVITKISNVSCTDCVKFLNKYISEEKWIKAKKQISCYHKHGTWIRNKNLSWKQLESTAGLGYTEDLCSNISKGINWQYEYVGSNKCTNIKPRKKHSNINEFKYMCQRMNGTNIFIIGDSMNFQYFVSFINILQTSSGYGFHRNSMGDDNNKYSQYYKHEFEIPCHQINNINIPIPNFFITYIRSDRLDLFLDKTKAHNESIYPAPRMGIIPDFHEYDYIHELQQPKNHNALVLFNRGTHFIETSIVLKELKVTLNYLYQNFKDITIIWRTTATGFQTDAASTFFDPPQDVPPDMSELNFYNYDQFEMQNLHIQHMLASEFPQILVSDVYHSTALRHDSRADNLHYCIPGPTNNWIKLLLYIFHYIDSTPGFQSLTQCHNN